MAAPTPKLWETEGLQNIQLSPPVPFMYLDSTSVSGFMCKRVHSLEQRKVKLPPGFRCPCGPYIRVSNHLPPWAAAQGFTALFTIEALPARLACVLTGCIHIHLSHLEKTLTTRHCVLMGALFRLREIFGPVIQ